MNGELIPGLMDSVRAWIAKNQDPETGLVFGLTVGEPLEIQTSKTYRFTREGDFPVTVIIWDKGDLNMEKADLTQELDDTYYGEGFEFDEAEPLIAMAEKFIKENERPDA